MFTLEVTIPREDRMEESLVHERAKYQELVSVRPSKRWRSWCGSLEVGSGASAGRSLCRPLERPAVGVLHGMQGVWEDAERA